MWIKRNHIYSGMDLLEGRTGARDLPDTNADFIIAS
jgi:hypothetical protein